MSDRFTYDGKYTRKFLMLSLAGAVLVGLGLWLSNFKPAPDPHGGGGEHHGNAINTAEMFAEANVNAPPQEHDSVSAVVDSVHTPAVHVDNSDAHSSGSGAGDGHGVGTDPSGIHSGNKPVDPTTIKAGEYHYSRFNPEEAGAHPHNHWDQGEPTLKQKLGSALLVAIWYFLIIAIFGVFIQAVKHVANAAWYVPVKRIFETFYRWLPIGITLLIGFILVFGSDMYDWLNPEKVNADTVAGELIRGKGMFLNIKVLFALLGFIGLIYTIVGHRFRSSSIKEDTEGGTGIFIFNRRMSAGFLPVFALSFVLLCFMAIMSLEVTWFSTIFGVYCFATMFVLGTTVCSLITVHMKEKGLMDSVTDEHIHDLSKFMFAFSIFWAYTWISQYLLIWYANIPEETQFYRLRLDEYKLLFFLNFILNFIFPFLAFMTRNAKRYYSSIKIVGTIILFARFLDIFLMVVPGVMKANWNLGIFIMCLGMTMLMGGIFLMVIFSGIAGASLLPKKHPFLEESLHHDVGI